MTGPFYKKDPDGAFKLAPCCKDCAFCDEETSFCCLNPCIYFEFINFESEKEDEEDSDE